MHAHAMTIALPTSSDTVRAAAEMYADLGISVTPVYGVVPGEGGAVACGCGRPDCTKPGKHPVGDRWQKIASADIDTVRARFASHPGNIGLVLGRRYVVLDVDGEEGFASLETLRAGVGVPPTLTSRSGSGRGEHHVYAYGPGQDPDAVTNRRMAPGLDIKTRTGQIVVAPSLHASGHRYEWIVRSPPAVLPQELYEAIRAPVVVAMRREPEPHATSGGDPDRDREHLLKRARAYVAKVEPAVEGSGGHAVTFGAARALAGFVAKGLGEGDAWNLLVEYSARCQPPWSERELAHKWSQAKQAHTVPALEDRPLAVVRPIGAASSARAVGGSGPVRRMSELAVDGDGVSDTPPPPPSAEWKPAYPATDVGNAQRLVEYCGQDFLYCRALGWLQYDGRRWAPDETGELERKAKELARQMYDEATDLEDLVLGKAMRDHARKSESERGIRAMQALARTDAEIAIRASQLDDDQWVLNAENGTIDLRTGHLRAHARGDLLTKLAPVEYDPAALCPRWDAFLERVQPDPEIRRFLQVFAGYSLTGSVREHCIAFLFGDGNNGKSVFLGAMREVMGDYACKAPRGLLTTVRGASDKHPTDFMVLRGSRSAWCSELNENEVWDEARVKDLASDDPITARAMHRDNVTWNPTHKLWVAGNHKPNVTGTDNGIWRRLRLVPFNVLIPPEEIDLGLGVHLRQHELPGILAWAVRGALLWQQEGLRQPAAMQDAAAKYREEEDLLGRFLADCCVVDEAASCKVAELYERYLAWAEGEGIKKTWGRFTLGKRLAAKKNERGEAIFKPCRDSRRASQGARDRAWNGLRVMTMFEREGGAGT